jgi:hypothetical protein
MTGACGGLSFPQVLCVLLMQPLTSPFLSTALPLLSAMTKTLDSTAVYAYTTLISMIICVPIALAMEGSALASGAQVRP